MFDIIMSTYLIITIVLNADYRGKTVHHSAFFSEFIILILLINRSLDCHCKEVKYIKDKSSAWPGFMLWSLKCLEAHEVEESQY